MHACRKAEKKDSLIHFQSRHVDQISHLAREENTRHLGKRKHIVLILVLN